MNECLLFSKLYSCFRSSGQWRLGGASLSTIYQPQPAPEASGKTEDLLVGFRYDFAAEDILLGEGSDNSMTELKPSLVTEFKGDTVFTLLSENISQSSSTETLTISNEESMREYADLKNSLLLYDTLLIFAGSAIVSLSSGESAALSFLTGGIGGFLYLLLVQRSVDELPAPESPISNKTGKSFGSLKGPVSSLTLALALTFTVIAVKFGSGDDIVAVTPREVVFGMMGFLVCKVAVLLAAFKPMSSSPKENL